MSEREAAHAMREAAAKKAELLFNCISLGPGLEEDIVARDTGKQIAIAIRAIPLPDPAPDPRDALIGTDVSDAAIADATIARLSGELEAATKGLERIRDDADEYDALWPMRHARAVLAKLAKGE